MKPVVIQQYNKFMGSVDNSDNLLANYLTFKSLKWYHKLLLSLINMVVFNSYIMNKEYGVKKMTHSCYREYIAKYLLTTSLEMAKCTKNNILVPIDNTPLRLTGRHFISKFESVPGSKHKTPAQNVEFTILLPKNWNGKAIEALCYNLSTHPLAAVPVGK